MSDLLNQETVFSHSGKVPKGVQAVQGIKSGSPSTPGLATQTTAKPVMLQQSMTQLRTELCT